MTFTGTAVYFSVFTVRGLFAFNDETTLLNQFGAKLSLLVSCLAALGCYLWSDYHHARSRYR